MGRAGTGGATVRRQSIASTNKANCAGVSVIVPSTSGGQTNPALLEPLGEQAQAAAVPVQAFEIMAAFAAEDEHVAAERIGADDLLHLGRQAVEPCPQINRPTGQKHLRARRQRNHPDPRSADRTRRNAFSLTPLSTSTRAPSGRSISITPTRSARARPAPRGHIAPAAIGIRELSPRCIGHDTDLNKLRRPGRHGSHRQRRLTSRSPVVQQAGRDPVATGNHTNLAALGRHLGKQRRLWLRVHRRRRSTINLPTHSKCLLLD
jgi:hypothetical protein